MNRNEADTRAELISPSLGMVPLAESQRIEFKRQITDGFEKEVVSFLNAKDGGIIYIGINDQGKAIALENIEQLQLKIKDRLKHNISP
ncbi:MAG: ATP-binding protein [Psychromonas sp.]|nr:ATP-binding protein [Psychromonas sp.]